MKVQEVIKIINNANTYDVFDAEDLIDYKKELDVCIKETHKWFIYGTKFYKLEDGILGIEGVLENLSEQMSSRDYHTIAKAFEAEAYTTIRYRAKV